MEENEVVQAAPEQAPEPSTEPSTESNVRLDIDERTGRRRVVTVEAPKLEPKPEPQQTPPPFQTEAPKPNPITQAANAMNQALSNPQPVQPPQPMPQPQPEQPVQQNNFYRPDEMVLAMQLGNVDESRIPPNIRPQYEALKNKDAPPPPTQEETEKAVRQRIYDLAREEAMKKSGATEDDITLGEFSDDPDVQQRVRDYKIALDLAQQRIIRDSLEKYNQMQAAAKERQEVINNVRNFIDEQRAKEPNFDKIGELMSTAYLNMPYQQAMIVAPVIEAARNGTMTQAQANILGQYYEICRKQLYAQINKTSVTPTPVVPKVEKRGSGTQASQPVDYAKMLRESNVKDKPRILSMWMASQKKGE